MTLLALIVLGLPIGIMTITFLVKNLIVRHKLRLANPRIAPPVDIQF